MTYNTGNPIGSTDARDRLDNTENMDILENSVTLNEHPDRLGVMRKTRKGMELEHNNQISAHELEHDNQMQSFESDFDSRLAGMAFTRVGTFAAGYTLTDARQVLVYETDGHEYGWTGAFPKVVTPASTPAGTGGIGAGAWVDRTDVTLRGDLNIVVKKFDSVAHVVSDTSLTIGQHIQTTSYYGGWNATSSGIPSGGNSYIVVKGATAPEDGGSFINLSNGLQIKGLFNDVVDVAQFGAKGDAINDDTFAINSALSFSENTTFNQKAIAFLITSPLLPRSNSVIDVNKQKIITTNGLYNDTFRLISLNNVVIKNSQIIGNHLGGLGFDKAFYIQDCVNIRIESNYVGYVGNDSSSNERGFGVILNSATDSSPVFGINGNFNIQIVGNVFDNIMGYGYERGDGVHIAYANDILVQGNKFIKTRRMSVAVTDYASEIIIDDNFFDDCYLAAIDIEPNIIWETTNSITITNNKINGFGLKPVGFVGDQYNAIDLHSNSFHSIVISGNTIKATSSQANSCIHARNLANKAIITGNILDCNGLCNMGMLLFAGDGFKDLIISNNKFINFVTYGINGYSNGNLLISNNMFISTYTTLTSYVAYVNNNGGILSIVGNIVNIADCSSVFRITPNGTAIANSNHMVVTAGDGIKIYTYGGSIIKVTIIGNILAGGSYVANLEEESDGHIYYSCGGNIGGNIATVFRNSSSFIVPYASTLSTNGTIVNSTWM